MKNNKRKTKKQVHVRRGNGAFVSPRLTERQLLVSMIRDDLVNYRLLNGLHQLGLVTEIYFLRASQTIFDYLGIASKVGYDRNYARYEAMKEEVMTLNLEREMGKLNKLAEKMYAEVVAMR